LMTKLHKEPATRRMNNADCRFRSLLKRSTHHHRPDLSQSRQ
jgi:hypothetical protein